MSNVVITSGGLDYVLSANSDQAITIKVGYFLPVYDYRIDGTIQTTATTSAFSAIADDSLTEPIGEILWNVSSTNYSQSEASTFLISADGYGDAGSYVSPFQTQSNPINLLNGSTISNHLSGDSLSNSGTSWVGIDGTAAGSDGRPTNTAADYFVVKDYYPVRREVGSDELRGNFRCVLQSDVGKIRFNKIALYAVALFEGSTVVGSEKFFAECYLNEPITKTGLAVDGFDSTVLDFQLDLHSISANWEDVFFSTSSDWQLVPNGLHTTEKISIGVFDSVSTPNAEPQATVHAGHTMDDEGNYDRTPQLRLEYPNTSPTTSEFMTMEISGDGNLYLSATQSAMEVLPLIPECKLGTSAFPFDSFTFSGAEFADGNVRIKSSDHVEDYGPYFQLYKQSIITYDDLSASSQVAHNVLYGFDIVRNNTELLLQTRYKDIYILAGAAQHAGPPIGGVDSSQRHYDNISAVYNEDDLTNNAKFNISAATYIVARNAIKTYGPLEINYIPYDTDEDRYTYTSASGVIYTKREYLTLFAGKTSALHSLDNSYEVLDQYLYSNAAGSTLADSEIGSNFDPIGVFISSASVLFIAAGQIRTYGDIKPGSDEAWKLGDTYKKWSELHTSFINLGTTNQDQAKASSFYGMQILQSFEGAEPKIRRTYVTPALSLARGDIRSEELFLGKNGTQTAGITTESYTKKIKGIYTEALDAETLTATDVTVTNLTATNIINNSTLRANSGIYSFNRDVKDGVWYNLAVISNITLTADQEYWHALLPDWFQCRFGNIDFSIIGQTIFFTIQLRLKNINDGDLTNVDHDIGYFDINDVFTNLNYSNITVLDDAAFTDVPFDAGPADIKVYRNFFPYNKTWQYKGSPKSDMPITVNFEDNHMFFRQPKSMIDVNPNNYSMESEEEGYYYITFVGRIS